MYTLRYLFKHPCVEHSGAIVQILTQVIIFNGQNSKQLRDDGNNPPLLIVRIVLVPVNGNSTTYCKSI